MMTKKRSYSCGVWFNTETGEQKWCLFDDPEGSV